MGNKCVKSVVGLRGVDNTKPIITASTTPDIRPHGGAEEEDLARDVDHGGVEAVDDGEDGALPGVASVVAEACNLQCLNVTADGSGFAVAVLSCESINV